MNENLPETIRVAFYIRVSTKEQTEKYGIELQRDALNSLLKTKMGDDKGRGRMVLAGEGDRHVYIDDISGTTDVNERPAFTRLIEDVLHSEQRPFDLVVVYKIDRFARKLKILLDILDFFEENKIGFISVHESIDTSTPFGRAMFGVMGVIAELERNTIKDRTTAGKRMAFESGTVMGPNAPYGYDKDENKRHKIVSEEADTVRLIFDMFVNQGKSLDFIAKYLTAHEIPSPEISSVIHKKRKGSVRKKEAVSFWRAERVSYILRSPIYMGDYYSNKFRGGTLLPKSEWKLSGEKAPSIIDPLIFEKAQKLLVLNQHTKQTAKDGHVYLLKGLLKCDCCYNAEKHLNGRVGWHGERKVLSNAIQYYYKCGNKNKSKTTHICPSLPIRAKELEEYIVNFSKKLLNSPIAVFNHQRKLKSQREMEKNIGKKENRLLDLINAIPKRREQLLEQHELSLIDTPTLKRQTKELDEKQKEYQIQYEEVMREKTETTLSKGYLEVLDLFSKQYTQALDNGFKDREKLSIILHQLIDEITVYGRPVEATDGIAGMKKEGQIMPNRIHIKLKLPQDTLSELLKSSGLTAITSAP